MADKLPEGWSLKSTARVFESPWVKIRKELLLGPGGEAHDWYIAEYPDIVLVFAVTEDGRILTNRQFKFGIKEWVVEPIAGFIDPGETPEAAARRELAEETGYAAERFERLGTLIDSPTSQDNRIHIFYAEHARPAGPPNRESAEVIEELILTPAELRELIQNGGANTLASVAAFFLGLERLKKTNQSS